MPPPPTEQGFSTQNLRATTQFSSEKKQQYMEIIYMHVEVKYMTHMKM